MIDDYYKMVKELKENNAKENNKLRKLDLLEYNSIKVENTPDEVWRSNRFAVQVFHGDIIRLSIVRTMINKSGKWIDGITWDELQEVKNQCGFKNKVAVELYPPVKDVVNVANVRHLFILDDVPEFMWRD